MADEKRERKYFGTDGVRDLANSGNMTPEFALKLGRAFIKFNHGKKIVIGLDTRLSGKMLEGALSAGITSQGADVFSAGIIPTPGVSYAIKALNADGVDFTPQAEKDLKLIHDVGKDNLLVCMAKTQYSLTDDPAKIGRPKNFRITVREVRLSAGAGFLVAITGAIMTMPGLPKKPAAFNIDVDENGKITGLF